MKSTERNCGIQTGKFYLAQEIIRNCGISSNTLQLWIDDGLRFVQPRTRTRFFLGDDVIAFLFGRSP